MRSVILAFTFLFLIQFSYARWVEKTTSVFMTTKPNTVSFAFDLDQIPVPGSKYYAELQLVFTEMFDEFSVDFEGSKTGGFVAKEKGTTYTIVLNNMDGGVVNGWSYSALQCGTVRASLTSTSKIASAKLRLNLIASSTPQCKENTEHHHPHYQTTETHGTPIVLILLISFASLFCLCCTISCVRRCAARRCNRKFKPVEEAYPAEAINAETPTGDFDTAQQQQQYVFPYPVMAVPVNNGEKQQYVQLMPVMYPQQ